MACYGDQPGFGSMLVLLMTAPCSHEEPAIVGQQTKRIANLRAGKIGLGVQTGKPECDSATLLYRNRYMMCRSTNPSSTCRKALGTVPTMLNPNRCHRAMARWLVLTTALNCMA